MEEQRIVRQYLTESEDPRQENRIRESAIKSFCLGVEIISEMLTDTMGIATEVEGFLRGAKDMFYVIADSDSHSGVSARASRYQGAEAAISFFKSMEGHANAGVLCMGAKAAASLVEYAVMEHNESLENFCKGVKMTLELFSGAD